MSESFYRETQISNGPLLVTHNMPARQSVALGIFINVGSRDETEAQAGITHALEHMLFKGTKTLNVHQLAEKLDELGGNANAFTSRERTCFHLHVLREQWQDALDILTSMVCEPALPENEWQREREVIFSEMAMVDDLPDEWIVDQHLAALFPHQSIGRPVLGCHDALSAMTSHHLRDYLAHWYRPPRILIAAAGAIEHDAIAEALAQRRWPHSGNPLARKSASKMETGVQLLPRQIEQAQLLVSFPGIRTASAHRPVAWLANQLLGGGMSSHLFREIREKRGLAYSVGASLHALQDTGLWSINCAAEIGRMRECIEVTAEILADFPERLTEQELQRAKRQMAVQFRMGMDSVEGQMLYLGERLDEAELLSPLAWVEKIEAIGLPDVQQWSRKQLASPPLWSIAAPEQALAKISDTIRAC